MFYRTFAVSDRVIYFQVGVDIFRVVACCFLWTIDHSLFPMGNLLSVVTIVILALYPEIARLSNENYADRPINSNELTIRHREPNE